MSDKKWDENIALYLPLTTEITMTKEQRSYLRLHLTFMTKEWDENTVLLLIFIVVIHQS